MAVLISRKRARKIVVHFLIRNLGVGGLGALLPFLSYTAFGYAWKVPVVLLRYSPKGDPTIGNILVSLRTGKILGGSSLEEIKSECIRKAAQVKTASAP